MIRRVIGSIAVVLSCAGCFEVPDMAGSNPLDPLGTAYNPPAPGLVTARAYSDVLIDVSWEDRSSWESGFRVERRAGGNSEVDFAIMLPPNTTTFRDTLPVDLFTVYTYRVAAVGQGKALHYGKEVSISVGLPGPDRFGLARLCQDEIVLAWDPFKEMVSGYELTRSVNGGAYEGIALPGNAAVNTWTDRSVRPSDSYTYRMRARTSRNAGLWSELRLRYESAPVTLVRTYSLPYPTVATYSKDESKIAIGNNGVVRILDARDGTVMCTFPTSVERAAFDPDGKTLVTIWSAYLRLWDAASGQLLWEMRESSPILALAFSPDGATLVAGGEFGGLILDMPSGALQRRTAVGIRHAGFISATGLLALKDINGVIRIIDPVTLQEHAHYEAWKSGRMAVSPDGLNIVTVSKPGEIALLRSADLSVIATGDYPSSHGISDLEFLRTPRGIVLGLSGSGGGVIEVRGYDLVRQMSFTAESDGVRDISPSRLTTSFVTCAASYSSQSVKVWALDGYWKVVP